MPPYHPYEVVETEKPRFMKVAVSIPWELLKEFDELVAKAGYSRSEAIREGMRMLLDQLKKRERLAKRIEED